VISRNPDMMAVGIVRAKIEPMRPVFQSIYKTAI